MKTYNEISVGKHSFIMYTIIHFRSERWLFRLGTVRSLLKDLWEWRADATEPHHIFKRPIYEHVIVNSIRWSYNGQIPQKNAPSEIFIMLH